MEKLPALNTAGDIVLLDCSRYVIGDRQQVEIAFSDQYAFINNQGTWRFVSRVVAKPWMAQKRLLCTNRGRSQTTEFPRAASQQLSFEDFRDRRWAS